MNKPELIDAVAREAGVDKRQTEGVLNAFFEQVKNAARSEDKVSWPGFGSFGMTRSAARMGRNPRTGEPTQIAASNKMKFTPSSTLKEFMNSPAKKASSKSTKKR